MGEAQSVLPGPWFRGVDRAKPEERVTGPNLPFLAQEKAPATPIAHALAGRLISWRSGPYLFSDRGRYSASIMVTSPVVVFSNQLPCVVGAPVVTALQAAAVTIGVQVIFPNGCAACRFASMVV